ncbi:sugar kinase [Cyanobium sp.]|nr:sugar kinase [Cyanobium sp.]
MPLALGFDLGSSGARLALVGAAPDKPHVDSPRGALAPTELLWEGAIPYGALFEDPNGWRAALLTLAAEIPTPYRSRIGAIAIDGTSGTLLLCRPDGSLLPPPLHQALPYHLACPAQATAAAAIAGGGPAASASGSLARALALLERAEALGSAASLLLRHQADWLMGWLLGDWRWGEEGNNLRLGWNLSTRAWCGAIAGQRWSGALPAIQPSGRLLGPLAPAVAAALQLPSTCRVVTGSTDANAGVLAAAPGPGDGITVLGTTLVLKQFVAGPLEGPGLSCHRVADQWLVGGASNAGAGILQRFFSDPQIATLSRQIDPDRPSGLELIPLPSRGERFPVDNPNLEAVLEPRPVSDALYLQGLLEGLTAIEAAGWRRLRELGAPGLQRVITLGGGARNPQWRRIRERALGVPVLNRPRLSAARGMAQLALGALIEER